jgi:general secretion pathway protein C
MVRYLSWLANAALLTLGCFLVANTANAVFAALLTPSPAERAPAPAPEPPAARSWSDRQKILDRNLFNASMLAPAAAPKEIEEDLQATKLPLELLGTVASPDPQLSWAAIQDKEERKHLVLQLHDDIKEGKARVTRIERKRVVLSENGELRELVLVEAKDTSPSKARASKRSSRKRVARSRREPRRSPTRPPPEVEQSFGNPVNLLSQARLLPKFEEGEMVGVQVSGIEDGSLYEEIGIQEGDVVTEINGIKIDSPEQGYNILKEIAGSPEIFFKYLRNGESQTGTFTMPSGWNQ